MFQFISSHDHSLMRRVHSWPAPMWIRVWMVHATRAGDGWLWFVMGLVLLAFGGPDRLRALAAASLAAAAGVAIFELLKHWTGRLRPCDIAPHCWAKLLPPDRFSFPSGHTIFAFAVVTPLMLFYPSLTIGLLFCAVSIAISRILLGMHFLSDVVAGAVIGVCLGYAAFCLFW